MSVVRMKRKQLLKVWTLIAARVLSGSCIVKRCFHSADRASRKGQIDVLVLTRAAAWQLVLDDELDIWG